MNMTASPKDSNTVKFGADRRVRFEARYAVALAGFISTERTRHYMYGIHVEPHPVRGVLLVATDGHKLAVIHDEAGETNGEWICEFPSRLMSACKVRTTKNRDGAGDVHFIGHAGHVTAVGADISNVSLIGESHLATEYAPAIDGTFPNWRAASIWPSEIEPIPTLSVDAEKLKAFSAAAKAITSYANVAQIIVMPTKGNKHHPEYSPSIVRIPHAPQFCGCIMPMRDADSLWCNPDSIIPDFIRAPKPEVLA